MQQDNCPLLPLEILTISMRMRVEEPASIAACTYRLQSRIPVLALGTQLTAPKETLCIKRLNVVLIVGGYRVEAR